MEGNEPARALVVEDDESVRTFLIKALESNGLAVTGVATARAALEAVRGGGYELLFADGLLPDMHGLDLLRAIAGEPSGSGVALCLLSGTVRRVTGPVAGISAMTKPVRLADLAAHIAAMRSWEGSPLEERLAALEDLRVEILIHGD